MKMLKLLVQDENGLIKTENGEPVLSCDADDVANAAIDFLGALIGPDLKELISDYNQMHELIETERAENNKTVQDANDTAKRYKKLAEDYNALLAISQRYQEQIRDLQKQVTSLKNENAKLQKCVTAKDNEFSKLKTQLNNVKRKNDEIRAENNRISNSCNSQAFKLAAKNKAIVQAVEGFKLLDGQIMARGRWNLKTVQIAEGGSCMIYDRGIMDEVSEAFRQQGIELDPVCNYWVEVDFTFFTARFFKTVDSIVAEGTLPIPPEVMAEVHERMKRPTIVFDATQGTEDSICSLTSKYLQLLDLCAK